MLDVVANLHKVQHKIAQLDSKQQVKLLAVSKTQPIEIIKQVYDTGQKDFGENYLQEALVKVKQTQDLAIVWHFIGSIQSNKTKDIALNFDWVHSVNRLKIAKRLSEQRPDYLSPLNICLQVNIDDSKTKSGALVEQLPELIAQIENLPNLKLRGLMCIPHANNSERAFMNMQSLFKKQTQFDVLSMGMSNDLELAIQYGSTMVRVGTGIFGKR